MARTISIALTTKDQGPSQGPLRSPLTSLIPKACLIAFQAFPCYHGNDKVILWASYTRPVIIIFHMFRKDTLYLRAL